MFYYLEGNVSIIEPGLAVIDAGGVGYACAVSVNTLSRLTIGQRARLYTYCNIKEDAFDIFGFHSTGEKRCFEQLLSVSGVGPKAALAILSVCSPESLALAVINEDAAMITQAAGVGKKLALRVILELRDKVAKDAAGYSAAGYVPASAPGEAARANEAASALAVLGYTNAEISALLRKIDAGSMTTEEVVREALRQTLK